MSDNGLPKIDVYETGRKIKLIALNRGISARDLGDILGICEHTIWRYFRGQSLPSLATMACIAKIFRMRIDSLLVMEDE